MPCRPSAKTLKQLSLDTVAENLELLCYGVAKGSKALSQVIESDEYKQYRSPFSTWPSSLLEDLGRTVYARRCGLKHLLYPVIQPQITSFAISLHGSIHVAMDLITRRCRDLTKLEMTFSVNLPPNYYVDFFSHFPKLTSINLYGSMVDDNAFGVIGRTCPGLVELNAAKTWITNRGLALLSVAEDCVTPRCLKLININLQETRVTSEGASIFLQSHPHAFVIDHPETFHCFASAPLPSKLTKLTSTKQTLSKDCYAQALKCTPGVNAIVITSPGIANEELYQLMMMRHLRDIHLSNTCSDAMNFYEGLAPVLDQIGHQLKRLVLQNFTEIDVIFIGQKCPNLKHLALSGTKAFAPVPNLNSDLYQNLVNLELWSSLESNVCPRVIKQLLINASLTHALFQSLPNLTDSLLLEVWEKNPMTSMTNVVFDQCHNVTNLALWKLLQIPNALRILRCWNCQRVSELDKTEIQRCIKDSNLTLYWEWYPYYENQSDIVHDWEEYEVQE